MKVQKSLLSLAAICLIFLLFSFTCTDHVKGGHTEIQFINNSDKFIHVINVIAKDTIFSCAGSGNAGIAMQGEKFMITPGAGVRYWETIFERVSYIQLFVFSETFSVENCLDEEKVKEFSDKYLLQRYQLTKEDLDRMDWTITYTGEE